MAARTVVFGELRLFWMLIARLKGDAKGQYEAKRPLMYESRPFLLTTAAATERENRAVRMYLCIDVSYTL